MLDFKDICASKDGNVAISFVPFCVHVLDIFLKWICS